MNMWKLPTSLTIGGVGYPIRTDFRDILHILRYFGDPDFEEDEKWMICFICLFEDYESIPKERVEEAAAAAVAFIDAGIDSSKAQRRSKPATMDWDFDAPVLIPAINKVLGAEVRTMEYLHWWTFLGAYMEISGGLFSSIMRIRDKKARHEKMEKDEKIFYAENRHLINLPKKYTKAELDEKERLLAILNGTNP